MRNESLLILVKGQCFKLMVPVLLLSGYMSGLDYAVISEWFDWILRGSVVTVDLIGIWFYFSASHTRLLVALSLLNTPFFILRLATWCRSHTHVECC